MAIDFHKWKAEPSGMHSHAEHGNEEALAILSRFVFVAEIRTHVIVLICYPISNFKFPVSASEFQARYSTFNPILQTTQQKSVNRKMKAALFPVQNPPQFL